VLEQDGREVCLSHSERQMVVTLASEPDRLWLREDLERAIADDPDGRADGCAVVTQSAYHLREKAGRGIIDTRWPIGGYRLGAVVRLFTIIEEIARNPEPMQTFGSERAALAARLSRAPGAHPAGEAV